MIKFLEPQYLVVYKNGRGTSLMIPEYWKPTPRSMFSLRAADTAWSMCNRELLTGEIVTLSSIKNLFKGKITDVTKLRETLPKNIIVDGEFDYETIRTKNDLTNEIMRNIKFCIDLSCSGKNPQGIMVFRIFNSFFELRDHYRDHHDRKIDKDRILLRICFISCLLSSPSVELPDKLSSIIPSTFSELP